MIEKGRNNTDLDKYRVPDQAYALEELRRAQLFAAASTMDMRSIIENGTPEMIDEFQRMIAPSACVNLSWVLEIQGIQLVHHKLERPPEERCDTYVFGFEDTSNKIDDVFDSWVVIPTIEEGSIVTYMNIDVLVHIGRGTESKTVISKWGEGHVFEHPPLFVPSAYGQNYLVFKDMSRS